MTRSDLLTEAEWRKYRECREKGYKAEVSLCIARGAETKWEQKFERNGYLFRVHVDYSDSCFDSSDLGCWSSTWKPGAIDHHKRRGKGEEWNSFRWFIPEIKAEEERECRHQMGMSKHEADCRGRALALEVYNRACDFGIFWSYNTVVVRAYKAGIELGCAAIGGIESDADDSYMAEVVDELAVEAEAEAEAAMERLCATCEHRRQS